MNTALIDGDVIVYSVGFASDTKTYHVGDPAEPFFESTSKKEVNKWCEENDFDKDVIDSCVESEPLENCLHSVKKRINSIMEATGADRHEIYLSGSTNFRDRIVTHTPDGEEITYKGNREGAPKPTHYSAIRSYLKEYWNATVAEDEEADDLMGINQDPEDTVICTIDKDLNMVDGYHYNWNTGDIFYVDIHDGLRFFYEQMLIGDPVDNIQGVPKIGKVKAKKILEDCTDEFMLADTTMRLYYDVGKSPQEYLNNGRLLWIRRMVGEMWTPPT